MDTIEQDKINQAVIVERIDNLKTLMMSKFDENAKEHEGILAQTTKTNGKVAQIDKWHWMMVGALIFIGATLIPIITIIATAYFQKH